jgi:malate dehydrogenase (quinone)
LLGASPGASVSVNIVFDVIKLCFADLLKRPEVRARLKEMLPTHDEDLKLPANAERFREVSRRTDETLQLVPNR